MATMNGGGGGGGGGNGGLSAPTAGVPGRSNLDDTQELYYPPIMRAIADTGFQGFVGQEFRPRGDKRQAMIQAVELCDV